MVNPCRTSTSVRSAPAQRPPAPSCTVPLVLSPGSVASGWPPSSPSRPPRSSSPSAVHSPPTGSRGAAHDGTEISQPGPTPDSRRRTPNGPSRAERASGAASLRVPEARREGGAGFLERPRAGPRHRQQLTVVGASGTASRIGLDGAGAVTDPRLTPVDTTPDSTTAPLSSNRLHITGNRGRNEAARQSGSVTPRDRIR